MATFNEQGVVRFQDSVTSVSSQHKSGRARPPLGASPQPSGSRESSANRRGSRRSNRREDTSSPFPEEPAPEEQAKEAVLLESKTATIPSAPPAKPSTPSQKKQVDTSSEAAVSRLLHAMALKEAATARLIHVEVEKAERAAQQTVGALSVDDVLTLHRSAADMVYAIAHKEQQFVSKLTVLLGIVEAMAGVRTGAQDDDLDA